MKGFILNKNVLFWRFLSAVMGCRIRSLVTWRLIQRRVTAWSTLWWWVMRRRHVQKLIFMSDYVVVFQRSDKIRLRKSLKVSTVRSSFIPLLNLKSAFFQQVKPFSHWGEIVLLQGFFRISVDMFKPNNQKCLSGDKKLCSFKENVEIEFNCKHNWQTDFSHWF